MQYSGTKTSRLSRFTIVGDVASTSTEAVLLGTSVGSTCAQFPVGADCLPAEGFSHSVGSIRFASDKTMYVTSGDAADFNSVTDAALRSQDLDSLAGKLLHVRPRRRGITWQPVLERQRGGCAVEGVGLRPPERVSIKPAARLGCAVHRRRGVDNTTEEVDVGAAGANLGWPCYEGTPQQPGYASKATCQTLYARGVGAVRAPLIEWDHANTSSAATGGTFYTGASYPAQYQGAYFYGDYGHRADRGDAGAGRPRAAARAGVARGVGRARPGPARVRGALGARPAGGRARGARRTRCRTCWPSPRRRTGSPRRSPRCSPRPTSWRRRSAAGARSSPRRRCGASRTGSGGPDRCGGAGVAGRMRALMADSDEAEAHFAAALRDADRQPMLEVARTRLHYGELLRRARRKLDARDQLRAALTTFESVGAEPWAERARAELRASGEGASRPADDGALAELTPQEREIALLVTGGATNREVAAQLFLSVRTVEYHLHKIYTRLGITSRVALAGRISGSAADPAGRAPSTPR